MNELKTGQIVFLRDVGFPYNRTENKSESWEGASCVVVNTKAGANKNMIEVEPFFQMKGDHGEIMKTCIFHPECVKVEHRPWLKSNLYSILRLRKRLVSLANEIREQLD